MFMKIAQVLALGASLSTSPAAAAPHGDGITADHVCGIWTNINQSLVAAAQILAGGPEKAQDVTDLKPKTFSGKTPADTMKLVLAVQEKVNRLRAKTGLEPVAAPDPARDGRITAADLLLSSGGVQDGMVDWIISNSGDTLLVSPFYARRDLSGKTPDEAFGLIELAARRIDRILASR